MTTTIGPVLNGGPFDDEGPVQFPTRRTSVLDDRDVTRFLESSRSTKQIIKEASGHNSKNKPSVKKGKEAENLAKKGKRKKKRGPFGEAYKPVPAGGDKGIRV